MNQGCRKVRELKPKSQSSIRCLGSSVIVKEFGHKNGRIKQNSPPLPQKVLRNRFLLTSGSPGPVLCRAIKLSSAPDADVN